MINPRLSAERVFSAHDDRERAAHLYDLFIYARTAKGPEAEARLDDAEEFLYSQTEDSEQSRTRFREERLGQALIQTAQLTT